jgi:hypothetical protein
MDDYFTLNRYDGKIYKTTNMLGKTLAQYCPNDSALKKEQARIEAELKAFEQNIFGNKERKDSIDSISKMDPKEMKALKKKKDKASKSSVRKSKSKKSSGGSSSGTARVSVRRQRH